MLGLIVAGQSIGNYRILSKIGTGGMGAVYLAEHPLIGKKVALKVIHHELAGNREVVQRFFQEAKVVNTIGNEHIVEIHDFGVTPENDHFYIMEYLEGQTLAAVVSKEKTLDVMRALHVGAQIASALSAAHVAGVIHRDLKPDNIMLMKRLGDPDFVKVLDFGLAKMFAAGSTVKTAAGVLLGTPQYMSPEACESKRDIDHRTDVYALGILLFQMMTGVLPFDGESMGEVLVKQVTALPPAPRALNPRIPPSVEQILLRCLAKPVEARFQSMLALREALLDPEGYLRGSPPIAPARSVRPSEAGVDAKTVMMQANAMHEEKANAQQKTRIAKLAPLPAPGAEPWQVAPTVMGDADSVRNLALPLAKRAEVPGLAQPSEPNTNTMRIATPIGYSSRPPRKMWPIVLVLGLLLGLGGGAFAVAWVGRSDEAASGSAPGSAPGSAVTGDGGAVAIGSGGGRAGTDAGRVPIEPDSHSQHSGSGSQATGSASIVKPRLARLTIESKPANASVYGPDGKLLGETPLEIEWPISPDVIAFELRLAGYRKKPKPIVVGGNTTVGVELERAPVPNVGKGSGAGKGSGTGKGSGGKGKGSSDTGLIRPGD